MPGKKLILKFFDVIAVGIAMDYDTDICRGSWIQTEMSGLGG